MRYFNKNGATIAPLRAAKTIWIDDPVQWKEFIEGMEDMLNDSAYDWANDTVSGIHETVTEQEAFTERQRAAINNIKDAVLRRR